MKSMVESSDPEKYLSEIVSCIMFCVKECAPMKTFRKRRQQTRVTFGVKNLLVHRGKAVEIWIKKTSIINRNQLKLLRNEVTNEIRKAKKDYNY